MLLQRERIKLGGGYAHFVVSIFGIAAVAEFDKSIATRVESPKFLSVLFSTVCIIDRREGRNSTSSTDDDCHFSSFARERKLAWNTNEGFFIFSFAVQRAARVLEPCQYERRNGFEKFDWQAQKNSMKEKLTDLQLHD